MKSYEMYIFDLDDTLIRTFETATKLYYPRFSEILNFSYPGDDVVRTNWGKDLIASLEEIFGSLKDQNRAVTILENLIQESPIQPVDGIHQMLSVLKKHGKFIGLYSSSHPSLMELCLNRSLSDTREYFDFILSTIEQQILKPSPHIIFLMIEQYRKLFHREIELSKVLVVGDSVADFEIARNAEVDFAAVLTGPTSRDDFLKAGLNENWIFTSVKEALVPPSSHGVVAVIKNESDKFLLIKESRKSHPYIGHWSGPHGICKDEDILEEETVVRETQEESGLTVKPLRKLYTRAADTKVRTVSFWETEPISGDDLRFNSCHREVGAIAWYALKDIKSGKMPLYPGTRDFFNRYEKMEDVKNDARS